MSDWAGDDDDPPVAMPAIFSRIFIFASKTLFTAPFLKLIAVLGSFLGRENVFEIANFIVRIRNAYAMVLKIPPMPPPPPPPPRPDRNPWPPPELPEDDPDDDWLLDPLATPLEEEPPFEYPPFDGGGGPY